MGEQRESNFWATAAMAAVGAAGVAYGLSRLMQSSSNEQQEESQSSNRGIDWDRAIDWFADVADSPSVSNLPADPSVSNRPALLRGQEIRVISTVDGCRQIVSRLYQDCEDYNVMGFDCEWVTHQGQRQPVSILQLASPRGFCAVIRLNKINQLPAELRNLLKDRSIVKVGVAASDDASKLLQDYDLEVRSFYDLRFLAARIGLTQRSLVGLAKETLYITMDKDWCLRTSDWDRLNLSEEQIRYAADDAYIGVLVFKEMARLLLPRQSAYTESRALSNALEVMTRYLDKPFPTNYSFHG